MRPILRCASFVCVLLFVSLSVAQVRLLVGARGLTESRLRAAVANFGSVEGSNADGFFVVELHRDMNVDKFKAHMMARQVEFVFDISADQVDRQNLASLRRHIEYVKARYKVQASGDGYKKTPGFYAALEYYLSTRVGPDGTVDQDLIRRAIDHRDHLPPATLGGGPRTPTSYFTFVGPRALDIPYQLYFGTAPLAGRVNGIAWAASNVQVAYLATAGGGVWKTTNMGEDWVFRSNGWPMLHTTGIAVHPANENIVLAGTGDAYGFFGAQTMGIMRSTNGGVTWTQVGATQFGNNIVTRILFDPDNPSVVLACTSGATGGIWRSSDGGLTWTVTDAPTGKWDDIDFGPLWNGVRQFWAVSGDGSTGGVIARSVNGGLNWTVVRDATTTAQTRLDVACSKDTPGKVYVLHPNSNTMFRTTNSGTSWVDLNLSGSATFPNALGANPAYNWGQDTYDLHVTTSVSNTTEYVWVGLITLAVSTDSGANWVDFGRSYQGNSRLHNDQHCFTPHPTYGFTGMAGNDGGVFLVTNAPPVVDTVTSLNRTLYNTQFYHMSVHPTNHDTYVMGGTQDNASPASRGNLNAWKNLEGGDGSWSGFQPSNPSIHVTSSQAATVYRYTSDDDPTGDPIEPAGGFASANFIAPLIYTGNSTLLAGANFTAMRWSGVAGQWTPSTNFSSEARVFARGINNTARVYAGTNSGRVYRSDDNGANWSRIDVAPLQIAAIGAIACSWSNSIDVVVGLNRPTGGLYRCTNTTDAAPVWTSVSGTGPLSLPQSPVNAVIRDPYQGSIWYVGTDVGLFMTTDGGATWKNMGSLGIPNVHVNALAIPDDKSHLYVATFGYGIWRVPLANNTFTSFTTSVSEVFGDQPLSGTLTLSLPAPNGGVRATMSTTSPYVSVPTDVWFNSGATTCTFPINTSQVFSSSKTAYVYATCMGIMRVVAFTLKPYPTVESFMPVTNYLYGGASTNATATLSAPAPFVGQFTFSEDSAFVTVVSPVTIGAGQTSKVTIVRTTNPETVQSVRITAMYKGTIRTTTLHVYPCPVVTNLLFDPNPLLSGFSTTCTIILDVPAPITTRIAMQDDSPYIATTTKTIQAGQQSLTFLVYGSNPPSDVAVTVQAKVVEDVGAATEATLQLLRSELTSISIAPNPIRGGSSGVASVSMNRAVLLNRIVGLTSSNRGIATVPSGVTMLAGNASVTATVRTTTVTSSQSATISANYLGTTAVTTLTVTP